LNNAVDGLGEEIASDINELETVIKAEGSKIEFMKEDINTMQVDARSCKLEMSKIIDSV
jgi:hypothetical protein